MSMGDKVTSIWQRASDEGENKDQIPWHLRYGGRTLGTFAGIVNVFTGVWSAVSILFFNTGCFMAGAIQLLVGVLLIGLEAPFLCVFIDQMQHVSDLVESKPYWTRASGYIIVSLIPLFLCFGPSTFIASALIFGTGLLYGLMSIGKKAPAEQMKTTASTLEP